MLIMSKSNGFTSSDGESSERQQNYSNRRRVNKQQQQKGVGQKLENAEGKVMNTTCSIIASKNRFQNKVRFMAL